jgi:hypothetical protein
MADGEMLGLGVTGSNLDTIDEAREDVDSIREQVLLFDEPTPSQGVMAATLLRKLVGATASRAPRRSPRATETFPRSAM